MSFILDSIFPKKCFGCNKEGVYFCPKCLNSLESNSPKLGRMDLLEGSLSLFPYKTLIKKAIKSIKYEFTTDIVKYFSTICANTITNDYPHLLKYWQKNNFTIIPIPLHNNRENWRGFNQSTLLGKQISRKLKLNFYDELIIRSVNTIPQVKLKQKTGRLKNMKNVFSLNSESKKIINKNIILFDDVATTRSTLNSALKTINYQNCWFLTIAG